MMFSRDRILHMNAATQSLHFALTICSSLSYTLCVAVCLSDRLEHILCVIELDAGKWNSILNKSADIHTGRDRQCERESDLQLIEWMEEMESDVQQGAKEVYQYAWSVTNTRARIDVGRRQTRSPRIASIKD